MSEPSPAAMEKAREIALELDKHLSRSGREHGFGEGRREYVVEPILARAFEDFARDFAAQAVKEKA